MKDIFFGALLVSSPSLLLSKHKSIEPLLFELALNKLCNTISPNAAEDKKRPFLSAMANTLKRATTCRVSFIYYQIFSAPLKDFLEHNGLLPNNSRIISRTVISSLGNLLAASTLYAETEPSALQQLYYGLLGGIIKYAETPTDLSDKPWNPHIVTQIAFAGATGAVFAYTCKSAFKKNFNIHKCLQEACTGAISYITYNILFHDKLPVDEKIYFFMATKAMDEIYKSLANWAAAAYEQSISR